MAQNLKQNEAHALLQVCPARRLRLRLRPDEAAGRSRQVLRETAEHWKDMIEAGNKDKIEKLFETGDRDKIEKAAQETLDWLFKNQFAQKDEFEAKQKVLEDVVCGILDKNAPPLSGGRSRCPCVAPLSV